MLEIRNKLKSPIQIIVRSTTKPRALATLNIPGVGSGKNICWIEDERHTEYIDRLKDKKLISVERVLNK